MCSALRRATVTVAVIALLAPGLIQARPFDWVTQSPPSASTVSHNAGFFSMVYNLLANIVTGRFGASPIGSATAKDSTDNGGRLDPNGLNQTDPPPDNGGHLDPNG
ncbi:MAG TPA: hypothetical protein VLV54_21160 [Thermoanaerobaculia bacterium]|nr:hypothetical protein [Thermoanaerobaculia bacterium]